MRGKIVGAEAKAAYVRRTTGKGEGKAPTTAPSFPFPATPSTAAGLSVLANQRTGYEQGIPPQSWWCGT